MSKFIGFLSSYFENSETRFNVGTLLGLIFNSAYIVFSLVFGIMNGAAWYVSVSAYYTLVVILRYLLIGASDGVAQISAGTVGELILLLLFPMSGIIAYTVFFDVPSVPHRAPVVLFGLYAAFGIIRALYGIFLSKNKRRSVYRTSYFIRLSLAFISLFNFQTSLLSMLGARAELSRQLNFLTGGAVSVSMLLLARESRKGDSA